MTRGFCCLFDFTGVYILEFCLFVLIALTLWLGLGESIWVVSIFTLGFVLFRLLCLRATLSFVVCDGFGEFCSFDFILSWWFSLFCVLVYVFI